MFRKYAELKIMVESGNKLTREAVIVPLISQKPLGSYQLCFGAARDRIEYTLRSERAEESREFKTVNAAVKVAVQLGFEYVSVYNPN